MSRMQYKNDLYESVHQSMTGLYRTGVIDKITMREFDEACLAPPSALAPGEIRKLRQTAKVSQPVFARHLGTTSSTVEKWETGARKPSVMALKLLAVVKKHGLEILA